eukprot:g1036.t1
MRRTLIACTRLGLQNLGKRSLDFFLDLPSKDTKDKRHSQSSVRMCTTKRKQAKTLTLVALHLPQVVEDLKPQESCAVRFHSSRAHEFQQEYSPAMRDTFSPAIKPHYRRLNLDRTSDSVDLIPHDPSYDE